MSICPSGGDFLALLRRGVNMSEWLKRNSAIGDFLALL